MNKIQNLVVGEKTFHNDIERGASTSEIVWWIVGGVALASLVLGAITAVVQGWLGKLPG